ncbi:MAG: hypothetical protein ACKOWG_08655 [Planctomycetia bacterium]
MTVEERIKAAFGMRQRFSWLTPAPWAAASCIGCWRRPPASFTVSMARKDVRLMVDEAAAHGCPLVVMPAVAALYDAAVTGSQRSSTSAMLRRSAVGTATLALEYCLASIAQVVNAQSDPMSMRSPVFMTVAIIAAFTGAVLFRPRSFSRPIEHVAPLRPSRHVAPPEDVAVLNSAGPRRVPESLAGVMVPDGRPTVVMFLKADCGCSEDFARLFSAMEPQLATRASCLAVIEATNGDAGPFLLSTGLTTPYLVQSDGGLAAAWGVTKAGCVALVRPDGAVEAIWPGISRQGFRDVASRLGDADLLPPETLAVLPGAATAGCPLVSASLVPLTGVFQ